MNTQPDDLIQRPNGSYVSLAKLSAREQLSHELTLKLFPDALRLNDDLIKLKKFALGELRAYRDMMMSDYEVKVGGPEGGFSVKTVCGTKLVRLAIAKTTTLGEERDFAKKLIDEYLEQELQSSSEGIREFVNNAFKVNKKGRFDTARILGLRDLKITDPIWLRAMKALDDAMCHDSSTVYVRFYEVDTERKQEHQVELSLSKA